MGKKIFGRYAAVLCLAWQMTMVQASNWNVDALMAELAQTEPGRASFVEKKTLMMLEEPVVSSGELLYTPPSRLERKTLKPREETMIVEGDVATIVRGNRTHTMQLQEYPELTGVINSIRGTLAGNREVLERSFDLKLSGSRASWRLNLKPADAGLARMIRVIRMEGAYGQVRSIELEQMDGDSSIMTIRPLSAKSAK